MIHGCFSNAAVTRIVEELHHCMRAETMVTVEFVDQIPLSRTGKRSPVVSEIEEDSRSLVGRGDLPACSQVSG
jgi:hypothetical protein